MDPGPSPGKEGWWLGKQFRMQELLAIKTFENMFRAIVPAGYVLTVPIEEIEMEFKMATQLDWSQGHAELPKDALDATAMTCKQGGEQPHLRHTFWVGEGIQGPRARECQPGCVQCQASFTEHGHKRGYQSVGKKGLYMFLTERSVPDASRKTKMDKLVAILNTHEDFKPKMTAESSMVHEMYEQHDHWAFFGVKYHAELAAIERKWMHMKRAVRGFMNGNLQNLKDLLDIHWQEYTVMSARKDMRHCRDTCAVYRDLGKEADLTQLEDGQKEYTSHRRVFDGATNMLKAAVRPEDMTEKQLMKVSAMKKTAVQKKEKDIDMRHAIEDNLSKRRRRDHEQAKQKKGITIDKRKFNGKGGKNEVNNKDEGL